MNKTIYPIDEWKIKENEFNIETNYRDETIFSLGNGYFGMRGTFEEGYSGPKNTSFNATYINGFYETYDIVYPEGGYGFPKQGEAMISVADSKIIKLSVCDEDFDLIKGNIISYARILDMKKGYLERKIIWESPHKRLVELDIKRLISLKRQHLGVIIFSVKPLNFSGKITFISEINGNIQLNEKSGDVRVGNNVNGKIIETLNKEIDNLKGWICQSTKKSKLKYVCAYNHDIKSSEIKRVTSFEKDDMIGVKIDIDAQKDKSYVLTKYISYYTSRDTKQDKLVINAVNEVENGKSDGAELIFNEQREFLKDFWDDADIEISGNLELQQGIRYNEFQLLQSVGRSNMTNISAKGLTGEGYEGHYFWDSDVYIMPFFLYTMPQIAKYFVMYRYNLLDAARRRAKELGYNGALYPWRTISGRECSAFFPAGTAQYHIDADVAFEIKKYVDATEDYDFLYDYGAEIIFETARLWISIGSYIILKGNKFCINCVTGPDEYTAIVNNNAYTNYMAKMNLEYAFKIANEMKSKCLTKYMKLKEKIKLDEDEIDAWDKASKNMYLPYSEYLDIIPQDDSFLYKERLNASDISEKERPILLYRHYLNIYRYQICKQPDVLLLMFLENELFSKDKIKRNFDYYEPITTHDSSLSPAIFSILANEIGYYEKAYDYFMMTARMDLDDKNGNVKDGIHTACMAGTWSAVVNGFGGVGIRSDGLHIMPSLPKEWNSLSFKIRYKGFQVKIKIDKENIALELINGDNLKVHVFDDEVILRNGKCIIKRVNECEI